LLHLLGTLKSKGFHKATVTTADEPFFTPAQRMYRACGFTETARRQEDNRRLIDYQLLLSQAYL
jgi:hypothetical protein